MKRTLLFIACVLASLTMAAQEEQTDYIPFVELGKQWHMVRSDFNSDYHLEQYMLNEEVVKDGKTYLKMHRSEGDMTVVSDADAGLLREENRKVYLYDTDMQKEHLLFDYSLKAGNVYETYSFAEQKAVTYIVLSVGDYTEGPEVIRYIPEADSMRAEHRYLRKWTVCRANDNTLQKTWIEGVGSLEGPLATLYDARPIDSRSYLAYVEHYDYYFPFSFYDTYSQIHGCNLPTGEKEYSDDWHHQLTYELEGNRLHVYGKIYTQCGPNNYIYFTEEPTDDPLVRKLRFSQREILPHADCTALHATNFYVPGFDPNMNYIVVDDQGAEHPVVNKTPQTAYRPMIEDGKVWKLGGDESGNPVRRVEYYYFDGDTIINGKTCMQMMCQRYVSPDHPDYNMFSRLPFLSYVGAWYEEDKKVYVYDATNKQFMLMYDFSVDDNDTLQIYGQSYVIGPKQTGGIKGFKGVYRDILMGNYNTTWLEGVGGIDGPTVNVYLGKENHAIFLMSCSVGDEIIYFNDDYEDGASPDEARKGRIDFTHTIKTKPKAPRRREAEAPSLYGEYNDSQLGLYLEPLDEAYLVRISDETGKVVYEKAVNAGSIVGLNIDISAYPKGSYTVTVENSRESYTGTFVAQATGISALLINNEKMNHEIYNLQGQRLSTMQKGVNIINRQKVYVK